MSVPVFFDARHGPNETETQDFCCLIHVVDTASGPRSGDDFEHGDYHVRMMATSGGPGADRSRDTRSELLDAAAQLIAASPGASIVLRDVCAEVGVRLPTLYHFFGSKEGLLDAVTEHGYGLYLAAKRPYDPSEDPVGHIRWGWDTHFGFGLANRGLYVLMYGRAVPGRRSPSEKRVADMVLRATEAAESAGRLVVPAEQAAAHVLAAVIGVTLRQVVDGTADAALSAAMREATIAAITGAGGSAGSDAEDARKGEDAVTGEHGGDVAGAAAALLVALHNSDQQEGGLAGPELVLFEHWLGQMARD